MIDNITPDNIFIKNVTLVICESISYMYDLNKVSTLNNCFYYFITYCLQYIDSFKTRVYVHHMLNEKYLKFNKFNKEVILPDF